MCNKLIFSDSSKEFYDRHGTFNSHLLVTCMCRANLFSLSTINLILKNKNRKEIKTNEKNCSILYKVFWLKLFPIILFALPFINPICRQFFFGLNIKTLCRNSAALRYNFYVKGMSLVIVKDSVIMKRKLVYYMNTKTYCPYKQILSDVKHPKAKLRQTGSMEI